MLFICYPKCSTCQKARKWLEEHGVEYTERHIVEENPTYDCFLQALFGQSCKTFLDIIASPNWTKLQSLDWQLSCQPHSHCRPYLVVTA